uniref:Uncharacterized protein n=1 Tax=Enterobius vermicularis TaxID=51028 RepID=A0A0N4V3A0_ENTVE
MLGEQSRLEKAVCRKRHAEAAIEETKCRMCSVIDLAILLEKSRRIFDTGDYIRRQSVSEERRAKGID